MLQRPKATANLTFLGLIDYALRIYRRNFLPFFALSALVQIPFTIVNNLLNDQQQQMLIDRGLTPGMTSVSVAQTQALLGPMLGALLILAAAALVAGFVQTVVVFAPISHITSENYLGRNATLRQALAVLRLRLGPLTSGVALYYGIIIGLGLALMLTFFLCGLGFGILVYVGLVGGAFMVPVLMLERTSITTALSRSWMLGKSRLWPLIGLTISVYIVAFVLELIISIVITGILTRGSDTLSPVAMNSIAVISSLGSIFIAPVLPIGYTLLYYNSRIRQEGLDIALRASNVPDPSPAHIPSPAPGRLFANEDFLNLALVVMGTFVVMLLIVGGAFVLTGRLAGGF